MTYKVFLVEDEIVTREGIRDNVNWKSAGFEFCGEAADGETAVPLIEAAQPDILITDIKMPFMDGLQLSKIIRTQMPWIKIVILSGHDEFEYAQAAVKIGATEYLLKPVSSNDLLKALKRIADLLDQEKKEQESYNELKKRDEGNLTLIKENFLLRLVMGGISSADAIEQSRQFGLDIIAQHYLALLFKVELCNRSTPFDYHEYQHVENIISSLVNKNPDIQYIKKDLDEIVLLLAGSDPAQLQQDGHRLSRLVQEEVEKERVCNLAVGIGSPQQRLGDIHHSFTEALVKLKESIQFDKPAHTTEPSELMLLDNAALGNYLKSGDLNEYQNFFKDHLLSISKAALKSELLKNYLLIDTVITISQFINRLGGRVEEIVPEINAFDKLLGQITNLDQMTETLKALIIQTMEYRDHNLQHTSTIIQEARSYIDVNSSNPDIKMHQVASHVNLSPGHFSTLFSRETGTPFRDYLTSLRINHAKELLRTTNMKSNEIASRVGYNDPHYFSTTFKKNTGLTPQQFRAKTRDRKS